MFYFDLHKKLTLYVSLLWYKMHQLLIWSSLPWRIRISGKILGFHGNQIKEYTLIGLKMAVKTFQYNYWICNKNFRVPNSKKHIRRSLFILQSRRHRLGFLFLDSTKVPLWTALPDSQLNIYSFFNFKLPKIHSPNSSIDLML